MKSKLKALVVAAHSDDEALGCGGTMARLAGQGWDVGVVFMTNGVGARPGATSSEASKRHVAAEQAVKAVGARLLQAFDFPDNALDSVPLLKLAQAIETAAAHFAPQLVLTHFAHDLNVDHRLVHQAVITAFRPMPDSPVEAVLCFEVASSTGWQSSAMPAFRPVLSIDITGTLPAKLAALQYYDVEMRSPPHPRSPEMIEALARVRGSQAGLAMAEAFEIQRVNVSGTSVLGNL
ncbi:MAG: family deacetylase [Verrucomicrobiaceae bacterium]|nr:family deacetylase [Verrucomicrobiaceae bacterium]